MLILKFPGYSDPVTIWAQGWWVGFINFMKMPKLTPTRPRDAPREFAWVYSGHVTEVFG